jgi:16S rRNA (guanine(966)-N(2))-methyltransferase RsmD
MMKKYIRIVAGKYRRTPIEVIEAQGLRPTPDRVRETLFNWLNYFWGGQFENKKILDLFAGSGALGFEAASRGASHVQMVENNPKAVATIRALRDKLQADVIRIHAGDAVTVLNRLDAAKFDLIFLDPPFGADWLERLWPGLQNVLEPNGLVYIEAENPVSCPEGYTLLRQDRAGVVHYHLFQIAALQK